jgi:hypothetical protein
MSKLRGTLASLVVALSVGSSFGAVMNPETFESYPAPDPNWSPTIPGEGWQVLTANGQTNGIDAAYGSSGNGLRVKQFDDNFNAYAYWDGNLDINTFPQQLFQQDFRLAEPDNQNYARLGGSIRIGPAFNYHAAWQFVKAPGSSAALYYGNDGGGGTPVAIPGGDSLVIGEYYTLQVEVDYTADTTRARFGPVGGPFNAWTPLEPLGLNNTTQYTGIEWTSLNGTIDMDNISIVDNAPPVPEPATAAAIGSLALAFVLRRSRRGA